LQITIFFKLFITHTHTHARTHARTHAHTQNLMFICKRVNYEIKFDLKILIM